MQRRVGKGQAHIAPPVQKHSSMGSDNEKNTRLNHRTFGVTTRIWIIVSLFLFIVTFTHFVLPKNHTPTRPAFDSAHLKPHNYLNASEAEPNPFEFCPQYGPGDKMGAKYGAFTLSQSKLHVGSSSRIQRVISRALKGHSVTISVIGGSISACHGAGDDPISPVCYPSRFFQWWNTVFPHPASELTNGAMRRTNSAYFGFCNAHHMPDVTDLVIIELDVDDPPDQDMTDHFELLVRSILLRHDQPAVLILGHFSPQVHETSGFAGPDHWHNVVAQFYDVPHISIKAALYPSYMNDPSSISQYYADPVLANAAGHEILSDMLISYFQSQVCTAWSVATGQSFDAVPVHASDAAVADAHGIFGGVGQRKGVPPEEADDMDADGNRKLPAPNAAQGMHPQLRVPAGRINTRPNANRAFEEIAPFCVSANDLINPLPPSLFYGSGWVSFHPPMGSFPLETTAHYWYSTLGTSKLRIPIQLGAGDVGIYYMKEPINNVGEGSAIECWVDDNYNGAKVIENAADVGESTPALHIIDHFVTRGSHYVECQLLGEEGQTMLAFKILGIFAT